MSSCAVDLRASPIGWKPIAGVVATIFMWAAAYPAIAAALTGFAPLGLAALRYAVAAVALGALAVLAPPGLPRRRDAIRVVAAGALGISIYNLLLNVGQMTVKAGTAGLLVNVNPIIAALLGCLFLGERLRPAGWAGIAIAFAGAATIMASRTGRSIAFDGGAGLVLLAAFCLAAMFVVQKPLLARYPPLAVAMWIVWAGAALLLPFLPQGLGSVPAASRTSIAAVVFLGLGPAALAYVAWAYALAHFPVSRAVSFLYLVAPLTLLLAYLGLGETPTLAVAGGGALTVIGVFVVNRIGRLAPD